MCDGGGELEADVEGEGGGVPGDVVQLVVVPRHAHAQPDHAPRAAAAGGLLASHRGQHLHVTLAHSIMSYQLLTCIQAYRTCSIPLSQETVCTVYFIYFIHL